LSSYDARERTITWLSAHDIPANITKDNGTTAASIINQFEKPPYPDERVFFDPKNVDGIRTILKPTSTLLPDWKREGYAYKESVPINLCCVTKQGITGDKLIWKMESDLRNTFETYPLGSVRMLDRVSPSPNDKGLLKLYSVDYILDYKRAAEDYTSDVALSYGTGYYNDGSWLGEAVTGVADAGGDDDELVDDALDQANDYWNGAILQMISGNLAGTQRPITDFTAGTDTALVAPAFGAAITALDNYRITSVGQVEDGNTVTTTVGSCFTMTVTASAGNECCYLSLPAENAVTNLGLSSTIYTKIRWRYKTSGTNKAKIVLVFNDASTQEVLADSSSSTWAVGSATITSGKTIDHIRLHADHGAGADDVCYDWVGIFAADFTYPNATDIRFNPSSRNVLLGVPSSVALGYQNLGADPASIEIDCDLDMETTTYSWTRAGDTDKAEIFLNVLHNQSVDAPWQWLTWGNKAARVVLDEVRFDESRGTCTLVMHEFSDSNKANESYSERWNL